MIAKLFRRSGLIFVLLLNTVILAHANAASSSCFIAEDGYHTIVKEGECHERHSPCSTFKIAISLMGYNEKILKDETHPVLPFKKGYPVYFESWKQSQDPTSWIKNSCVWYSQRITEKLGSKKFRAYVKQFQYGNQDVSGDPGKDNGLTRSWLSSSLLISPEEEVLFLKKMNTEKLHVSRFATTKTKNILYLEDLGGWELYGKTGSGNRSNKNGLPAMDHQMGWFVGWIEKSGRKIYFANYIEDNINLDYSSGKIAKEDAKKRLKQLILSLIDS